MKLEDLKIAREWAGPLEIRQQLEAAITAMVERERADAVSKPITESPPPAACPTASPSVEPAYWIIDRMGGHDIEQKQIVIAAREGDPRPALTQLNAAISDYVLICVKAAVKAATAGMVKRPKEKDLTASTDQYGAVRCILCGCPHDEHKIEDCPRWSAERHFEAKGKGGVK